MDKGLGKVCCDVVVMVIWSAHTSVVVENEDTKIVPRFPKAFRLRVV